MKPITLIILLFFSFASNAQLRPPIIINGGSGGTSLNGTGFVKATGTTISYDNSTYLTSAGIAGKLNISDTASMLTNYRHWGLYYPLTGNPSGFLTSGSISGKLNISDTGSMLTNYRHWGLYYPLTGNPSGFLTSYTETGTVSSVGLQMADVIYNASVTNSPVTTSGTLTPTLKTQTANTVLAGPTTGSAATPTFRALVAADIPNLDATKLTTGTLPTAQTAALTGDVTKSAGSNATTIAAQAVTVSKMSMVANSMNVNATGSTAAPTAVTFKSVASQTYAGTITWTGTTPPSGTETHTYRWKQEDKTVTLDIVLKYTSASTATTQVMLTLPSDMPSPVQPSGLTAADNPLFSGIGFLFTSLTASSPPAATGRVVLYNNAANNGYVIKLAGASSAHITAFVSIIYTAQ